MCSVVPARRHRSPPTCRPLCVCLACQPSPMPSGNVCARCCRPRSRRRVDPAAIIDSWSRGWSGWHALVRRGGRCPPALGPGQRCPVGISGGAKRASGPGSCKSCKARSFLFPLLLPITVTVVLVLAILSHFQMGEGWALWNQFEMEESGTMQRELHLKELFQIVLESCGRAALYRSIDSPIDQCASPSCKAIKHAKCG